MNIIELCRLHGNRQVADTLGVSARTLEDMRLGYAPLTTDDLEVIKSSFGLCMCDMQQIIAHSAAQRVAKGKDRLSRTPRKNKAKTNRLAKT